jgi:hypothetical protein
VALQRERKVKTTILFLCPSASKISFFVLVPSRTDLRNRLRLTVGPPKTEFLKPHDEKEQTRKKRGRSTATSFMVALAPLITLALCPRASL